MLARNTVVRLNCWIRNVSTLYGPRRVVLFLHTYTLFVCLGVSRDAVMLILMQPKACISTTLWNCKSFRKRPIYVGNIMADLEMHHRQLHDA